ncbi:TPA: hypothetical protein ACHTCR_004948 [Pseudomonas putida]|uniref:hypothetical protein n=1 Tax=Pseudomonas putida TaxID=303 RepID=UPI000F3F0513|nr:hypothetical protein [Pseudomonas putida]RNF66526.1 hypothetical protein EFJ98_24610 [Pseudomonas putida]RNF73227.1 hypothetical protein EFJ98_07785 [Pseudomonas putida]
MSDIKCEVVDGEVDHDWKYVSDWGGDASVPGGTFDCSYLECRVCGEEDHNHPSPSAYAADAGDYE